MSKVGASTELGDDGEHHTTGFSRGDTGRVDLCLALWLVEEVASMKPNKLREGASQRQFLV
jgi:hypothetical protein